MTAADEGSGSSSSDADRAARLELISAAHDVPHDFEPCVRVDGSPKSICRICVGGRSYIAHDADLRPAKLMNS